MAENYPTAAFALLLVAGIIELISIIPLAIYGTAMIAGFSTIGLGGIATAIIAVCIVWFLIMGILLILSATWTKTGDKDKVHKGGILGLIAAILGIGPYGLTLILGIIGAVLALTWKPPAPVVAPPPPPPV